MEQSAIRTSDTSDDIDLRELISVLWKGKRWIAGFVLLGAVISVSIALYLPNIYRAQVVLAAAESGDDLSSLATQYGGLASLAGINLSPTSQANQVNEGIEILQSRKFIGDFVERHQILPQLMAADAFEPQTDQLRLDDSIYEVETGNWLREVDWPFEPEPSRQEAYDAFSDILSVSKDDETGFITVAVDHLSPRLSADWVSRLVQDLNEVMRDRDIKEAQDSISYLRREMENVRVAALQQAFANLIEEQTKVMMLASVREEYVFKTLDPAVIPEENDRPNRALICVLGTMLAGLLGVLFVVTGRFWKERDAKPA